MKTRVSSIQPNPEAKIVSMVPQPSPADKKAMLQAKRNALKEYYKNQVLKSFHNKKE